MTDEKFEMLYQAALQINNFIADQCALHKDCSSCPLAKNDKHYCDIGDLTDSDVEELIRLMETEQPNTYLDDFKIKYPKAPLKSKTQMPFMCRGQMYNHECPCGRRYDDNCEQCQYCWNENYTEIKGESSK